MMRYESYYAQVRDDLLMLLPDDIQIEKSLDVGCAAGLTSARLKKQFAVRQTVGIEAVAEVAEIAKRNIDRVYVLSAESEDLPFTENEFDLILFADVLEHLIDPWAVLKRFASFLRPGGYVLISLPNIQNWKILLKLMTGNFNYQEHGILDRTHLRFFTPKTARQLIDQAGLKIVRVRQTMGNELKVLNWLALGMLKNIFAYHIYILAQKRNRSV